MALRAALVEGLMLSVDQVVRQLEPVRCLVPLKLRMRQGGCWRLRKGSAKGVHAGGM